MRDKGSSVDVYVDGSFDKKTKTSSWAFCIIQDGKLIHSAAGQIHDKEINKSYQIGGECEAVIQALNWLTRTANRGRFHFDYIGLKKWIADLFGDQPWKTNLEFTKHYREYCLIHKDYIVEFIKVKSHTGNKWNDFVDELAKNS